MDPSVEAEELLKLDQRRLDSGRIDMMDKELDKYMKSVEAILMSMKYQQERVLEKCMKTLEVSEMKYQREWGLEKSMKSLKASVVPKINEQDRVLDKLIADVGQIATVLGVVAVGPDSRVENNTRP